MRSRLQKKIFKGASETLSQFNKEFESSEYAASFKAKDFNIPPMFAKKYIKVGFFFYNSEITSFEFTMKGKLEFDADKYHCTRYNDLFKKIVHLRAEYFKSRDMGARKEIAKEEFSHWLNYLEGRKEDLPMPNYSIDDKEMSQLKETFDRFKDSKTYKIASDQMTDFHSDYASKFKFKVPLHPKNMQQMIHPHFGYLCNFQNKHFSFDELIQFYNNQIISSYERTLGQELLADELACLCYWLIIDTDKKGVLVMNEFERLLQSFRFDVKPFNFANMKKEFIHTVRQNPGEFLPIENEDDHIIKFDFARRIFLDRGL